MEERFLDPSEFEMLAETILKLGHSFRFKAIGNSMLPFIFSGQIIEIQPVNWGSITRCDIVLCKLANEKLLLHRVVQVINIDGNKRLKIQGDAHYYPDGLISSSDEFFGRATAIWKSDKRKVLYTPINLALVNLWLWSTSLRPWIIKLFKLFIDDYLETSGT